MLSPVAIIDRVIAEHHKIRETIRLAGESLNDVESSLMLTRSLSGWTQAAAADLAARKDNLIQTISALRQGLNTHFGYEEKYLPPLFGEYLMKALIYEHDKVRRQIESAQKTVNEVVVDEADREALFQHKAVIQDNISRLLQAIEDHAGHEEIILEMIKSGMVDRDSGTPG
jgi:hemerythrin